VNLYSAIERREMLSCNLLHKKNNARIQNKRFCSEEGVEVPWSEVVKGYEYAKGKYVVVTDEDCTSGTNHDNGAALPVAPY
jgi:DNA end-binding protein Ku